MKSLFPLDWNRSRMRVFAKAAVAPQLVKGFRLEKTKESEAELYIYEAIGSDWWGGGVTAAKVADELKSLGDSVKTLNVHVNSPGGDVFDGVAIYNQFVQHKATVNMFIDGLAASAASVIAMAGDTIKIAENAMLMIHNPWAIVLGESRDMQKMAETLDKIKDTLVLTYERRSKQKSDDISKWMDEELWMTGQEAVDKGFADEVIEAKTVDASLLSKFAAHYKRAPAALVQPKNEDSKVIKSDFDEIAHLRRRLNVLTFNVENC